MSRPREGTIATGSWLLGLLLVLVAKTFLVWTHGSATERANGGITPNPDYTLADITDRLQYSPGGWQLAYDHWLLWTLLAVVSLLTLLALTVAPAHDRWRGAALIGSAVGVAITVIEVVGLVGSRLDTLSNKPGATFHGIGPGGPAAAVGFALLGFGAGVAPRPTRQVRLPAAARLPDVRRGPR